MPFTSFLFKAGQAVPGFTQAELGTYVAILNQVEGIAGSVASDDTALRVAIAINEAGLATLITYDQLCRELNLSRHIEPPEPEVSRGTTYPSPGR